MNKPQIIAALDKVRRAKEAHADRITEYNSGLNAVMRRLLHEAMAARMSPEDVAVLSGFTAKQVRARMRNIGLSPSNGKTVLSQMAAEALANNAALMGIEPAEMDLMSPLAYLPMGEQMRRQLQDQTVSQVHEVDPVIDTLQQIRDEAADYCNLTSNHDTGCTCFTVIKQIDNRIAKLERGE